MASFKDGVMGNSTKPLSNNFIDIGKKPKNPKDKKKLIEKIFLEFTAYSSLLVLLDLKI